MHIQLPYTACVSEQFRTDFKILNREKESKVKKLCKQVRDQIVWKHAQDTSQGLLKN